MWSQRKDFKSQYQRLLKLLPVAVMGGIVGGLLLLNTSESSFRSIIPYLILAATLLLAAQVKIKNWVVARIGHAHSERHNPTLMLSLVLLAAIYGGYFGAGLGVILMAVLGYVTDDLMTRLNFLKQALAFAINLAAAIYFAFSGKVDWMIAFCYDFWIACRWINRWKTGRKNKTRTSALDCCECRINCGSDFLPERLDHCCLVIALHFPFPIGFPVKIV